MAYGNDPITSASYVILTELENSYTFEEVLVRFDRAKMLKAISTSDMPEKDLIKKFVRL